MAQQPIRRIYHNARIYTQNPAQPWAEALALQGDTLTAVGSNAAILAQTDADTLTVDLGGRLILPGLCDAHIHMYDWSLNLNRPDLAAAQSHAEMTARIGAYAASLSPEQWVVCQGWNESWWGETDFPTAADLDAVTRPGQPAIAYRSDLHIAVVNTAALQRAAITPSTPNPPGGLIDHTPAGQPTGVLRELAIGLVAQHIPPPTLAELRRDLLAAQATLHRLGITAVHDQRMKDGNEGPLTLRSFAQLHEAGELTLHVNCNVAAHQLPTLAALGLQSGFGNDHLRLGHVKVFSDGSLGSRTAWMLAPFTPQAPGEPANYGVNVTPPDQMAAEFAEAVRLGFPVSVHAIGDRANRVVLDLLEALPPTLPPLPIPHRIEHVQILDPSDIVRLARLNATASVQPIHLVDDRALSDRALGERARHAYSFASLAAAGVRLVMGSDAPVADPNPFRGILAAVARRAPGQSAWYPAECLSLADTVRAYTLAAAVAGGWQDRIGALMPGKSADFIVLDRNLFELAADPQQVEAIADTQVLLTVVDGLPVYHDPTAHLL
jgi:predicted amidohydrolase YtcJ